MDEQQTFFEIFNQAIEALDITDLPQEFQEEYVTQFGDMVVDAVITRSLPLLDEDQQREVESLLSSESPETFEEVFGFLETNVHDFTTITKEEVSRLLQAVQEE